MFGAGQKVLLIRQDVVEDKELGGDGVALSSSSTNLPLLKNKEEKKKTATDQGQAAQQGPHYQWMLVYFEKVNLQYNAENLK